MKITNLSFRRCFRKAGGIHFGFTFCMPVSVTNGFPEENNKALHRYWTTVTICIGLIFWQFSFDIEYNEHLAP